MGIGTTPATTVHAIRAIALEKGINEDVVRMVVDAYHQKIMECLKAEIPFAVRGLGKFYHRYAKNRLRGKFAKAPHYDDKVSKTVQFRLSDSAKSTLHGWVHDLQIKTNLPSELVRLAIKPDEIEKIRRRKVLADQRDLGFRSDMLFDEGALPQHDKHDLAKLAESPSVDDIIEKIGMTIDEQ